MRVVFDTVGFVRALINPKSRWGRIVFDYAASYTLILSRPMVVEILAVLRRPEVVRLFQTLPGRDPATILHILQTAETIQLTGIPAVNRDPKDDKVLATAVAGKADYLVSEDRDLLDMERYEGIAIIDAEEFIGMLAEEQAA